MDIEEEANAWPIPPLLVQPLVENAVRHGLSGREEGGKIWIQARHHNEYLNIQVRDNGVGMSAQAINQVYKKNGGDRNRVNLGLRNINQRLENIFGPVHRLQILSEKGNGTTVKIKLPSTNNNQLQSSELLASEAGG